MGSGSAANSLVAYLLDITPVDPIAGGLVFERFLSAERASVPDIDVDFAADRRETVIQYLSQKHGPQHVAMACTFVTFGARQALRDVGMVLGFSGEVIDRVCEAVDVHSSHDLASIPRLSRPQHRRFDIGRIHDGNNAIDTFNDAAQELRQLRQREMPAGDSAWA